MFNGDKYNKLSYFYHYDELYKSIGTALDLSFKDMKLNEPNLIARLTYQIPYQVNKLQLPITALGAFVHQKPYIKFKGLKKKKIELGDLLLIRTLKRKDKAPLRTALLLQAKKCKKDERIDSVSKVNINQHNLYAYFFNK